MQIISPASSGFEYSPDTFELTGKLIVRNVDREKDIGLYQCLVNDAISTKLATLNVKKSFGKQTSSKFHYSFTISIDFPSGRISKTAAHFVRCFL